jgi:hypothetical protein
MEDRPTGRAGSSLLRTEHTIRCRKERQGGYYSQGADRGARIKFPDDKDSPKFSFPTIFQNRSNNDATANVGIFCVWSVQLSFCHFQSEAHSSSYLRWLAESRKGGSRDLG